MAGMGPQKVWLVLVVLLGCLLGVAFSLKPWQKYREQKLEAEKVRLEMRRVEQQRAELVRRQLRSESAVGRETQAREHGYAYPNEKPVEVK